MSFTKDAAGKVAGRLEVFYQQKQVKESPRELARKAFEIGANVNSNGFRLINELNIVAHSKLGEIVNDLSTMNTSKYKYCLDKRVGEWANDNSFKSQAAQLFKLILESLADHKMVFSLEDFFSANAPIVLSFYAYNPSLIAKMSEHVHKSFNSYISKSHPHGSYDTEQLRRDVQAVIGNNRGVPWHLSLFIDNNGKEHSFAELLISDFTAHLKSGDKEAMCILLGRINILKNNRARVEGALVDKNTNDLGLNNNPIPKDLEEYSSDSGNHIRNIPVPSAVTSSEAYHQNSVSDTSIALDEDLFSNSATSLNGILASKVSVLSAGLIEMIKKTNSAQAPMMYNRLLFWQTDLQAAAALVQRKIDTWKHINEYEKNLRSVHQYTATNLEIILNRSYQGATRKAAFKENGPKKLITISIEFDISDNIVERRKKDLHGEDFGLPKKLKIFKLKDIVVTRNWSALSRIGLMDDKSAIASVVKDISIGDTTLYMSDVSLFSEDQEIMIVSHDDTYSSTSGEVGEETGLYIKGITEVLNTEGTTEVLNTEDTTKVKEKEFQLQLKSPVKHNWPNIRKPFVMSKSLMSSFNIPYMIADVGEQDKASVSVNRKNTLRDPRIQERLSTLSSEWVNSQDDTDISIIADTIRDEISDRPDLWRYITRGMMKSTDKAHLWEEANEPQYNSFISMYSELSDYTKNKISVIQNKLGLTDEALQCFDTIGFFTIQDKVNSLIESLKNADPESKANIEALILEYSEYSLVFKVLFSGLESSEFKNKNDGVRLVSWLDRAAKKICQKPEISYLLDDSDMNNIKTKVMLTLNSMPDLRVIDLGASLVRGIEESTNETGCRTFINNFSEEVSAKYDTSNPEIQEVITMLVGKCPLPAQAPALAPAPAPAPAQAPAPAPAQAPAPKKGKTASSDRQEYIPSKNENISYWLKDIGRRTYIG